MNIKKLFKSKKSKDNQSLDIIKNEKETLDVPKVIIEDSELQVIIGQWLGILSSKQVFGNSHFAIYTRLSVKDLMNQVDIPAEKFKEITTKFGLLLKIVGIENTETCTLNQFDKNNLSFNCHFNNRNTNANISLKWSDILYSGTEFIINYKNESKTYDYLPEVEEENKPTRLNLHHYTIKNPENDNSCFRYLSPYSAYFRLTNGEYSLSIEMKRPENIKVNMKINYDYIFKIENEEQLQQYLLGLTFPVEINEVYKKICEILITTVDKYPSFKIEIKEKKDEKNNKTTDMIDLHHGQVKQIIITKNEKTIAIDNDGNWSYDSPKLTIKQNNKGTIDYSLNATHSDELSTALTPFEQYSKVCQEVEQIRKLTNKYGKKNF